MNGDSALLEQHRKFLRGRGVADYVAAERGYRCAIRSAELQWLGFRRAQQLTATLVIPVWSVRGVVEGYQLRPDKPRLNAKDKPRRHEMKAGGRMLLDVHPRVTRPRDGGKVSLIADAPAPLLITEGILKGDAAGSSSCPALLCLASGTGAGAATKR